MSEKLVIEIIGHGDQARREADRTARAIQGDLRKIDSTSARSSASVRGHNDRMGRSFGGLKTIVGGLGLTFGAAGLAKGVRDSVAAYQEQVKVNGQTQAALKSTGGAAKVTADEIENLAQTISRKTGIDDEQIQQGENLLLTFTRIRNETGKGNDVFNQATQAATDMSSALGTDLTKSAILVGKALNDPVKGSTALRRVGVSLTEQQQDQIKTLVKSNRTLDAQKLILRELQTEFGGVAAARATPLDHLRVSVENLEESIGKGMAPALDTGAKALTKFIDEMHDGEGAGGEFVATTRAIAADVGPPLKALAGIGKAAFEFLRDHEDARKMAGALLAIGVAAKTISFLGSITGITRLTKAYGALRTAATGAAVAQTAAGGGGAGGAATRAGAGGLLARGAGNLPMLAATAALAYTASVAVRSQPGGGGKSATTSRYFATTAKDLDALSKAAGGGQRNMGFLSNQFAVASRGARALATGIDLLDGDIDNLKASTTQTGAAIRRAFATSAQSAALTFADKWRASIARARSATKPLINGITDDLGRLAPAARKAGADAMVGMVRALEAKGQVAKGTTQRLIDGINQVWPGMVDPARRAGQRAGEALVEGIAAQVRAGTSAVSSAIQSMLDGAVGETAVNIPGGRQGGTAANIAAGLGMAMGGFVPGDPRRDGTLALLAGNEFVTTGPGQRMAVESGLAHPALWDFLAGNQPPHFAGGGRVSGSPSQPGYTVRGPVSWFGGQTMAYGGTANSTAGIAINPRGGGDWNSRATQSLAHKSFMVSIAGHSARLPVVDKGPHARASSGPQAGQWRAIDVTGPGVKRLGLSTSSFPTDSIGTAVLGGGRNETAARAPGTRPSGVGEVGDVAGLADVRSQAYAAGRAGEPLYSYKVEGKDVDTDLFVSIAQGLQYAAPAPAAASTTLTPGAVDAGTGKIIRPVSGSITGRFGENRGDHIHSGLDIAASSGTPVKAMLAGKVTSAGSQGGYGNAVDMAHAGGYGSKYAHLSRINTRTGARLSQGAVLGLVGSTGHSSGPHLHWEVTKNGSRVNPANFYRRGGWANRAGGIPRYRTGTTTPTRIPPGYFVYGRDPDGMPLLAPRSDYARAPGGSVAGGALIPRSSGRLSPGVGTLGAGMPALPGLGQAQALIRRIQSAGATSVADAVQAMRALAAIVQDTGNLTIQQLLALRASIAAQLKKPGLTPVQKARLESASRTVQGGIDYRLGAPSAAMQSYTEEQAYQRHILENQLQLQGHASDSPEFASRMLEFDKQVLAGLQARLPALQTALEQARAIGTPEQVKTAEEDVRGATTAVSDQELQVYQDQQAALQENTEAAEAQTAALEAQMALQEEQIELLREQVKQANQKRRVSDSQYDRLADAVAQASNRGLGGMVGLKSQTPGTPGRLARYR